MQQFPNCQHHPNSENELLWIKQDHVNLCCSQCLFEQFQRDSNVNLMDIIHLKLINKKSEEIVSSILAKNLCQNDHKCFLDMLAFINNFDCYFQQLLEINQIVKQLNESIEKNITEGQNMQKLFREKLSEVSNICECRL